MTDSRIAVILPAAGLGARFGGGKIELDLGGKPVFIRAVGLFLPRPEVAGVFLAVNPDAIDEFKFRWGDKLSFMGVTVVPGGRVERWETVKLALGAVGDDYTHVAVHDAARPLTSPGLIERVFAAALRHDAVIPALPVSATLKRVGEALPPEQDAIDAILDVQPSEAGEVRPVLETIDRTGLVEVQTPQVFRMDLIRRAYEAVGEAASVTDDAGLVEALGETVHVVEGESVNLKITRPADAELARAVVAQREADRVKEVASKRLFLDDDDDE